MKKQWKVIAIVVVALFAVSVTKDLIIKVSIEKGVEFVTGLKLSIGSLNVGIVKTAVKIKNLRVMNPAQFKDRVMVDMPEIYVDYDLPAIFKGVVHLRELRLNLREFVVVKNAKGELNLNSLKVVKATKKGAPAPAAEGGKAPNIQIDVLDLKIGKAMYKDYTASGGPAVKEYNVNINERYANITDPYSVVSVIVFKSLSNTAIANMANFDIGGLKGSVSDALSSAQNMTGKAADIAHQALKSTAANAPVAVKSTSETVQKAAGALGDLFKDTAK
ncbi:MAG: hypothetical protein WCY36_06515 [Candidatus Omnitrophota bacterium]